MRRTEHSTRIIDVGKMRYFVAPKIAEEVETMLRKVRAKAMEIEPEWVSVDELFPEINDPVMGPALYLRGIRGRENLTQKELAKKVGILQHHISEMERGKRPISKANAKKFAAVLNTHWKGFF